MSITSVEHATASSRAASARSQVTVLLSIAMVFAVLLLCVAGYMYWAEATYTGESLGLGYVFAILAAVPAGLALVLSLTAFVLRRRFAVTAAVLAWCAALVAVAPFALTGFSYVITLL